MSISTNFKKTFGIGPVAVATNSVFVSDVPINARINFIELVYTATATVGTRVLAIQVYANSASILTVYLGDVVASTITNKFLSLSSVNTILPFYNNGGLTLRIRDSSNVDTLDTFTYSILGNE